MARRRAHRAGFAAGDGEFVHARTVKARPLPPQGPAALSIF
jgi:hypothetical protein